MLFLFRSSFCHSCNQQDNYGQAEYYQKSDHDPVTCAHWLRTIPWVRDRLVVCLWGVVAVLWSWVVVVLLRRPVTRLWRLLAWFLLSSINSQQRTLTVKHHPPHKILISQGIYQALSPQTQFTPLVSAHRPTHVQIEQHNVLVLRQVQVRNILLIVLNVRFSLLIHRREQLLTFLQSQSHGNPLKHV
jgi:hypothetical protein